MTFSLPVAITDCFVDFCRKPIKQQETVMFHFEFKALREGLREIVATFSSDQLGGVDGSVEFEVFQDIEPMNTDK